MIQTVQMMNDKTKNKNNFVMYIIFCKMFFDESLGLVLSQNTPR